MAILLVIALFIIGGIVLLFVNVKEGMRVRKGDTIGFVGSTGNASPNAPHLHFAIARMGEDKRWWSGTPIDPRPIYLGDEDDE